MTGIFLQVRLASKRLYRKALLPLVNGNVIQHAMRALKEVPVSIYALLTDKASAPDLRQYAEKEGFALFEGPENDVLLRYCRAAEYYHVTRVIRATGDNPLVSPALAREIIAIHEKEKPDLSHFVDMPLGTGIEVVETEALVKAEKETNDPYEREHLTTYLYRNSNKFNVLHIPCPAHYRFANTQVSIDTREDYECILELYKELYDGKPIETDRVVDWIKRNGKRITQSR
ncbi:MAG: acylneuraminate cytidylyltransferase [Spirochaetales bacterium]|nr:acylneuraminate cytidylyltransferase [Spirochaetales bacterium]